MFNPTLEPTMKSKKQIWKCFWVVKKSMCLNNLKGFI